VSKKEKTKMVFGGMSIPDNKYFNDVYVMDYSKLKDDPKGMEVTDVKWHKIDARGQAPTPRKGHMAYYFKQSMIVFGGTDGHFESHDHKIYFLSLEAYSWKAVSTTSNNLTSRS
jgi:hypothetical protein